MLKTISLGHLQTNCSAARLKDFDISVPIMNKICPAGTCADCDWNKNPKCYSNTFDTLPLPVGIWY